MVSVFYALDAAYMHERVQSLSRKSVLQTEMKSLTTAVKFYSWIFRVYLNLRFSEYTAPLQIP